MLRKFARALVPAALLLTSACGGGSEQRTTLRVADQIGQLALPLQASGEGKAIPYAVDWSNLLGGPKVAAAVTGRAVDLGTLGDTPTIFAQAAGSRLRVVGVVMRVDPRDSIIALATRPDSPIRSLADLKGRSVSYAKGTTTQYLVHRALASAGLGIDDIDSVFLGPEGGVGSLIRGDVDVMALADPVLSTQLRAGKVRILAGGGEPLTREGTYIIASEEALADPKRSAAIGDFIQRLARSLLWINAHRDAYAAVLAPHFKVSPEVARAVVDRTPSVFVPIDDTVRRAYQDQANTFLKIGALRKPIVAAEVFDDRYNALLPKIPDAITQTARRTQ
ncbi:MAG: ABC transporter substrate-binding protein [Sphingomonas sp.]